MFIRDGLFSLEKGKWICDNKIPIQKTIRPSWETATILKTVMSQAMFLLLT